MYSNVFVSMKCVPLDRFLSTHCDVRCVHELTCTRAKVFEQQSKQQLGSEVGTTLLTQVNWMFCINISDIWMVSLFCFYFIGASVSPVSDSLTQKRERERGEKMGSADCVHFYFQEVKKEGQCIAETAQCPAYSAQERYNDAGQPVHSLSTHPVCRQSVTGTGARPRPRDISD